MRAQNLAQQVRQLIGVRVFQGTDFDDQARGRNIEFFDEVGKQPQVVVVIGHDKLIGPLVRINRPLIRKHAADFFSQLRRLDVRKGKDFDQALPAFWNVLAGSIQELGVHLGLFAFRHDEDRVAGFNRSKTLQRQGAIDEIDGLARADLL